LILKARGALRPSCLYRHVICLFRAIYMGQFIKEAFDIVKLF